MYVCMYIYIQACTEVSSSMSSQIDLFSMSRFLFFDIRLRLTSLLPNRPKNDLGSPVPVVPVATGRPDTAGALVGEVSLFLSLSTAEELEEEEEEEEEEVELELLVPSWSGVGEWLGSLARMSR